jgi:hypothetical protein
MAKHNPKLRDEARKLYLAGTPLPDITSKLSLPDRTLRTWAERYGWRKEREEVERAAAEKSRVALIDERAKVDRAYFGVWNRLLAKAGAILAQVDTREKDEAGRFIRRPLEVLKEQGATVCTLGLALLRAQKGHYVAGGWAEVVPATVEDEIKNLTDKELKREIADLHRELADTDRSPESNEAPPLAEGGAETQSA